MNRHFYDQRERTYAQRIGTANPRWLVLWGTYSRTFWAFPAFDALPGTIISASRPRDLIAAMRQTELAASAPLAPARLERLASR